MEKLVTRSVTRVALKSCDMKAVSQQLEARSYYNLKPSRLHLYKPYSWFNSALKGGVPLVMSFQTFIHQMLEVATISHN